MVVDGSEYQKQLERSGVICSDQTELDVVILTVSDISCGAFKTKKGRPLKSFKRYSDHEQRMITQAIQLTVFDIDNQHVSWPTLAYRIAKLYVEQLDQYRTKPFTGKEKSYECDKMVTAHPGQALLCR